MRSLKIIGTGLSLPENKININGHTRYRITQNNTLHETQLTLAVAAANEALLSSKLNIDNIDLVISASAITFQPIPCGASLILKEISNKSDIPCMDINTTCTSFITALNMASYLLDSGTHKNILIVSSDVPSLGINPNQKESFSLFSDAGASVVVSRDPKNQSCVEYSLQKTWVEGLHFTEFRGGGSLLPPHNYNERNKEDYMFDMNGKKSLFLMLKKVPPFVSLFWEQSGLNIDSVDLFFPHQASVALPLIMKKLKIPENKYINLVEKYGNMVSASVPFILCKAISEGKVNRGQRCVLVGTAAGMTCSILSLKY